MNQIGVIVTTYNRPDALAAVMDGYLDQTDQNFELIIADDGSTDNTRALVKNYKSRAPFEIRHVWQEDKGFRAAAIRNRAIAATKADYIIFTDGDCIPLPLFVARHRLLAEPGYFLAGNRVLLSETFTQKILKDKLPVHEWKTRRWVSIWTQGHINRIQPLLSMPDFMSLRTFAPRKWHGVKTCNLSAWRADLLKINGLDEIYCGWGLEDSDLVVRLIRSGVLHKSARFAAPVLHLWHKENLRHNLEENQQRLNEVLSSGKIMATQGVQQYL